MTLEQFHETYKTYASRDKIEIKCEVDGCNNIETQNKDSAVRNIKQNGLFKCRSCCYTAEGRKKISEATSYRRSDETKAKMSKAKLEFYTTPEGERQKKKLSKLTSLQHSRTNMDKSKRKVLYISAKNNGQIRVCNSSGEFVACEDILEKDPTIVSYESQVSYEINDRSRSLDFLISYQNGRKKSIEFKPKKRITETENALQLQDSEAYAKSQGWEFELWTEPEVGITSWKEATRRADEYRKTHYLIDYAAYRSEMDRKKAKRHYDEKIAKDKVLVFCEYCSEYHAPLRKTYDKAVNTKGRYICEAEGGHIGGSKPKKKKVGPYGPDFKKCSGPCDRILPIDNFSKGKGQCKECRAKHYAEKYHGRKENGS